MRKIMIAAAAAGLALLLTCSQAHAWAAYHRGFTSYNPSTGGFHHYGTTAAVGPYGAGYHTSGYSPYGGYHSSTYERGYNPYGGYSSASVYRGYSPSMYGGYTAFGHTNYYGNGSVVRSTTIYP
jgi:hypothetical protein